MNSPTAPLSPRAAPWLAALLLATTAGCIPQMWRVHPEARSFVPKVRTVAVLPAIRVFEVWAGDVSEEHEEYTAQGSAVVAAALRRQAVLAGVLAGEDLWRVSYAAPARHYFALDLPAFEAALHSFRIR